MGRTVSEHIENEAHEDFVSDVEIARRWHISDKVARLAIRTFERNPRFPKRDVIMAGKRYWPAVVAFMRWRYGLGAVPAGVDGPETFENDPARKRARQ